MRKCKPPKKVTKIKKKQSVRVNIKKKNNIIAIKFKLRVSRGHAL
jgi:hypothetical protein